jgi:hypothetical protein
VSAGANSATGLKTGRDGSRRWLLIFASSATVFSVPVRRDNACLDGLDRRLLFSGAAVLARIGRVQ